MSFSPRQIAAHWVPGFLLLAILFIADKQNGQQWVSFFGADWNTGIALLAIGAAGFVAGNVLDAIRDFLDEKVLDRIRGHEIEWDFIVDAPADKVQRIDDFYFAPYVLSANLVLGLLVGGVADLVFFPIRFPWWAWLFGLVAVAVFGQDAWRLRECIVEITQKLMGNANDKR